MALRLRRGTDSERQLITPLEGELIYTTDTKILYIGDGVTQGGLQVTGAFPESIDDLTDVDISSIAPTVGQVLTWNGEEFLPADTIGSGEQINADIIADDSTILIDSETQIFQGNAFVGDTFTGAFIGDGSQLTNLPIATDGSGIIEGSNYRINIAADDSTIMVDVETNTVTGNLVGDVVGSVFSDDSSLLLDSINQSFTTFGTTYNSNEIIVNSEENLSISARNITIVGTTNDGTFLNAPNLISVTYKRDLQDELIEPTEDDYVGGLILGVETGEPDFSFFKSAFQTRIDTVRGAATSPARQELWLNTYDDEFEPVFTVDSRGVTESSGPFKMPTYANDTDRDAKILDPEQGMIIFNQRDDSTGVPQFQGYDGVQWVDLH